MDDPVYSKAFDHFSGERELATQDEYNEQKIKPRTRRSAVKQSSKDVTSGKTTEPDIMGQTQTTTEYIDIFESESRRLSQKHKEEWERAHSVDNSETVKMRQDSLVQRGHHDEESTDYCYAYSGSVSRDSVDEVDGSEPMKFQRSVSLKDDYSQPPDRLSMSGHEFHGDYTEPYRTNMNRNGPRQPVQSAIAPDPGGIYELAKDISAIPKPNRTSSTQKETYSHLDNATNRLQQTKLADTKHDASYGHIWNSSGDKSISPNNIKTDRVNSGRTSSSSADEVFSPSPVKEIPSNYEEPWDSEEGQDRFSRLMKRAEKTDERRQSVDKHKPPVPAHRTSKVSVDNSVNRNDPNVSKKETSVTSPKVTKTIPPAYEDAWDLPEKQREFEEKLELARKSRASLGQLAPDNEKQGERRPSNISPVRRIPLQEEEERHSQNVPRSDSCRSLGSIAEKVDSSIPLEDQNFYHGMIKRSAAERMLLVFRDGSYLVRKSETCKNDYSLTLKGLNGAPMHMKISRTDEGKYILGENSPPFRTIPEMIDYYTCHQLPIQNAEKICLLYPIPC